MENLQQLSRVSEIVGDLRVQIGRLEVMSTEHSRWIEAHRARSTVFESSTNSRFEALSRQQSEIDSRVSASHHHIKSILSQMAESKERLRALEISGAGMKRLEIMLPLLFLVIAIVWKVPVADITALMPK